MQALLTARRTKKGQQEAFRRHWGSSEQPAGMRDAYLLEDEADPRETLSLGFWDTAEQLLAYRTSDAATHREQLLREFVAKTRWQRPFAAFSAADSTAGGSTLPLPLLLPLLVAAAGAGVFLALKRRRQGQAEEQAEAEELARQQPPSVSGETPPADVLAGERPASAWARERQTPGAGAPIA